MGKLTTPLPAFPEDSYSTSMKSISSQKTSRRGGYFPIYTGAQDSGLTQGTQDPHAALLSPLRLSKQMTPGTKLQLGLLRLLY